MTDLLILADRVEGLLPCPFCGGQGMPGTVHAGGIEWAQVECVERNCGATGPTPATEAEAIAAWNTRSPDLRTIAANQENRDA